MNTATAYAAPQDGRDQISLTTTTHGRAWATAHRPFDIHPAERSFVSDLCWRINREEHSLDDAVGILEAEGWIVRLTEVMP